MADTRDRQDPLENLFIPGGITSELKSPVDGSGVVSPMLVSENQFGATCPILVAECSSPSGVAGYGQLYFKSDGLPYFLNSQTSIETQIQLGAHQAAEMYLFDNTTETSIEAVDQWHGAGGQSAGDLVGWTFEAAAVADISSFADYSGTVAGTILATTAAPHGFATGDPICIVGTNVAIGGANEYAGVYLVTTVSTTEFYFTNAGWNATTTAKAILPDRLVAGASAAGTYFIQGAGSAVSAAGSKTYDLQAFVNATSVDRIKVRVDAKSVGEFSSVAGHGTAVVATGDVVWLAAKGITDATNLTLRNGNTYVRREHL